MSYKIAENERFKFLRSEEYNYNFDKQTGLFQRWGKTKDDDPDYSPFGPEIMDLEISYGRCVRSCKFCYKGNTGDAQESHNMTLDEFKKLMSKMPKTLTQIALGITDIWANPDFFPIMEHARSIGVIPNYTFNGYGMTDDFAKKTAELCGAVSVSWYNTDACLNSIKKLSQAGLRQCNIHFMLSEETFDKALEVVDILRDDPRGEFVNAIVFLAYKPKGNSLGQYHTVRDTAKYRQLIDRCNANGVSFGFDSCSAGMYMASISDEDKAKYGQYAESCESSLFSCYVNAHGIYYHCSFTEGEKGWEEGIDALNCEDFVKDVWNHDKVAKIRKYSIKSMDCNSCRKCLIFPEINYKEPK